MQGKHVWFCRRFPWGFLGMVGLIVAIEGAVGPFVRHSDFLISDWRQAAKAAVGPEATSAEVLCFGDSQTKFGLQPRVLEARLGRRTYNLAAQGGPAVTSDVLLRRVLEAGGRPRVILVNHMPFLLKAGVDRYFDLWPALLNFGEVCQLAHRERRANLLTHYCLRRILPSLQGRHAIRSYVRAFLRGEPFKLTDAILVQRKHVLANRGSILAARVQHAPVDPTDLDKAPEPWQYPFATPANLFYIEQFLDTAAAHGITVVWVLPPCGPVWQAYRDRYGLDTKYDRALDQMQNRYANLHVVDARHSAYDAVMIDSTHLDRRGAARLSADVAALVERLLLNRPAEPCWERLPNFRPSALADGLEDLEQTRMAFGRRDHAPFTLLNRLSR